MVSLVTFMPLRSLQSEFRINLNPNGKSVSRAPLSLKLRTSTCISEGEKIWDGWNFLKIFWDPFAAQFCSGIRDEWSPQQRQPLPHSGASIPLLPCHCKAPTFWLLPLSLNWKESIIWDSHCTRLPWCAFISLLAHHHHHHYHHHLLLKHCQRHNGPRNWLRNLD